MTRTRLEDERPDESPQKMLARVNRWLHGSGLAPAPGRSGERFMALISAPETYDIPVTDSVTPQEVVTVTATKADGSKLILKRCRCDFFESKCAWCLSGRH